jgi:hypothetical protein
MLFPQNTEIVTLISSLQDGIIGEILQTEDVPEALQDIFPKLPKDEKPPCGAFPVCTREGNPIISYKSSVTTRITLGNNSNHHCYLYFIYCAIIGFLHSEKKTYWCHTSWFFHELFLYSTSSFPSTFISTAHDSSSIKPPISTSNPFSLKPTSYTLTNPPRVLPRPPNHAPLLPTLADRHIFQYRLPALHLRARKHHWKIIR